MRTAHGHGVGFRRFPIVPQKWRPMSGRFAPGMSDRLHPQRLPFITINRSLHRDTSVSSSLATTPHSLGKSTSMWNGAGDYLVYPTCHPESVKSSRVRTSFHVLYPVASDWPWLNVSPFLLPILFFSVEKRVQTMYFIVSCINLGEYP